MVEIPSCYNHVFLSGVDNFVTVVMELETKNVLVVNAFLKTDRKVSKDTDIV